MLWSEFMHRRSTARAFALQQAAHPTPDALAAWRLPEALKARVLEALQEADPRPSPASFSAIFAPDDALTPPRDPGVSLAAHVWWARLEASAPAREPDDAQERRAWAIAALRWHGQERHRLERRAWGRPFSRTPDRDVLTLRLWRAWFHGDIDFLFHPWKRLFAEAAAAPQRAVMAVKGFPPALRELRREDLIDAFPDHCWEPNPQGVPAWREIAVRVLERAGQDGPIQAGAALLGRPERQRAALCATHHRTWRGSWLVAAPDPAEDEDDHRFLDEWTNAAGELGAGLDALLDTHLTLRLLGLWRTPERTGSERSWRVLRTQIGRARGRLRALAAERPDRELLEGLSQLDAPYERTLAAIHRYFWEWAWKDSRAGCPGLPVAVNAGCVLPAPKRRRRARTADQREAERTWLLLVALRGELDALRRWVTESADTNGSMARYLGLVPDALIDHAQGTYRTYQDLRASLSRHLERDLERLEPTLRAVAALRGTPARRLRAAVTGALGSVWHPSVPLPKGGFPSMIERAKALIDLERSA